MTFSYIVQCIKNVRVNVCHTITAVSFFSSILKTFSHFQPLYKLPRPPSASSPPSLVLARGLQETLSIFHICVEQSDHFMVFVIQYSGQKERRYLCPASFKTPSGSSFPIDRDIPESLCAGFALGAGSVRYSPVQTGCVGVITQLVDPLHKLTLCVIIFLKKQTRQN